MSSSSSIQTQTTKPKRPLSGYNLFYRYKRNSILTHISATDDDSAASIQRVITTLPGLEQTPPQIAASLSAEQIKEVRSLAIRNAMEGKIFPNENARNRLHRKVHGIGFVEMGKVMRETWSELDVFSKGVFDELAEIGRVRYRDLVAEYKRNESLGLTEPRDKPKKKRKRTRKTAIQNDCTASSPMTSIHSLDASPLVDLEPLSVTSIASRLSVSDAAMSVSHDRFRRVSNYSVDGNQPTPGSAGSNITAARNAFVSMVNKTVPPPPLFGATIQHQPHQADQMPTSPCPCPSADDYAELTRWLADESATNSNVDDLPMTSPRSSPVPSQQWGANRNISISEQDDTSTSRDTDEDETDKSNSDLGITFLSKPLVKFVCTPIFLDPELNGGRARMA